MSIKHIINEIALHFDNRPIKIAELGVLHGESIPIFLNKLNVEEYRGIDLFNCYEENKDGSYHLMKEHGQDIYNYISKKYSNNSNVKLDVGYTHEVVNKFNDEYFDLIFIDAGHEYPQVSKDIELWYPKMKKNGIFSGDDYHYPPVKKSVDEFVEKNKLKLYNSKMKNHDEYWSWYVFT